MYRMGFGGGDVLFGIFPVMFMIVFVMVIVVFAVTAVKGASQWQRNNQSPRLSVPATLVGKREEVRHRHHMNDTMHSHTSTRYYLTFQVESGDRMEFHVDGREYGLLVEGDAGLLTFQGTRYQGFQRGE